MVVIILMETTMVCPGLPAIIKVEECPPNPPTILIGTRVPLASPSVRLPSRHRQLLSSIGT